MFKRLATTVALGCTLALSVPVWVSGEGIKDYDDLTELQKETFQVKAAVESDPGYALEMLTLWSKDFSADFEDYSPRDHYVFQQCAGLGLFNYYDKKVEVYTFMYLSDDEITASLANESFSIGAECHYEVVRERKKRRDA